MTGVQTCALPISPEQILLPSSAPVSIYAFGCWARQTIVALQIVTTLKPTTTVEFDIAELRTRTAQRPHVLDRALRTYERRPISALRRKALARAEQWIVSRQEQDGSWGGIQPPWVWSIIALHARGYAIDHPVQQRALAGIETFTIDDEFGRRVEIGRAHV